MKKLRKIFYKLFKRYRRLELKLFSYQDADILLRQNSLHKDESQTWVIAKEEDTNRCYGHVFLERKVRIRE